MRASSFVSPGLDRDAVDSPSPPRNYAGVLPVLRRRNVVAEHGVAGVPCWETGAVLALVIRSSASRGRRG